MSAIELLCERLETGSAPKRDEIDRDLFVRPKRPFAASTGGFYWLDTP